MNAMPDFGPYKKYLPLALILLVFLVAAGLFLLRSPVLIVTDSSFSQLYGVRRLQGKQIKSSLLLFRRFIPVVVNEGAGPDLQSISVEKLSSSPAAVIFPYRYLESARLYKGRFPSVPVLVMGLPSPVTDKTLCFVRTDTAEDLYRAGLFAAYFSGGKRVLFFTDGNLDGRYREAFRDGLREQGFLGEPLYIDSSRDYSSFSELGCVVIAGPAVKFLDLNLNIPVILFSWIDPRLTPRSVKLVFDDSPQTLAVKALRSPEAGEILIPSEHSLLLDRMEEKKDFHRLKGFLKREYRKN